MRWRAQIFYWNEGAVSGVLCKNIFVADLLGSQNLFKILETSLIVENSENVVKRGCFLKILGWRAQIFYWNEGAVSGVLRENIFVADLLGTPYLFELLQSSLTFKNSKMW